MAQTIYLFFIFVSIIFLIILEKYISELREKKQLHKFFMGTILFLIIYNIGYILVVSSQVFFNYKNIIFECVGFLGVTFSSVFFLLVGLVYVKQHISFNYKYLILFIPPAITNIVLWTNKYHRLFYKEYGSNLEYSFGPYFFIAMFFTWAYLLTGIGYLIYFSAKNSGFFSKQTKLLILGTIVPLPFNVSWILGSILNIEFLKFYSYYDISPITLTVTIVCFALAIFKFDFLNIVPIALQKVVDLISDSYIVINEQSDIIDYNQTFINTFNSIIKIKRKENLIDLLKSNKETNIDADELDNYIRDSTKNRKSVTFEKQIIGDSFDRHFAIDITPIFTQDNYIGTIILLKDITEYKEAMELIRQTQKQFVERERLASLGELAGGVAHDINSPLSAVQAGIYLINMVTDKCYKLLNEKGNLTEELEQEIGKIRDSIKDCNSACGKMVKIVNSVRNNTRNLSGENMQNFYISNVIEDLNVLLNHQLKNSQCELVSIEKDKTLINGDPGKLGQVLTNLIVNAIQAYNGNPGKIEVQISRKENNVLISVADNAGGIPKEFREGIFKNILTTKGTQGTGLGLYFSYSIITGHFGGDMWFESEEGAGTTFYISIPLKEK